MSADQRVLRGVPATLSWQALDSDGSPAAPSGTVTVGVAGADGTVVLAAGTATTSSGDVRTVALTAAQTARLDHLTATWTTVGAGSQTTTVDVVGGYFFTLAEAYAVEGITPNRFDPGQIFAARAAIEEDWERICGRAFVPRYERETLDGFGDGMLLLRWASIRTIRSVSTVSMTGVVTAYTADQMSRLRWTAAGVLTSGTAFLHTPQSVIVEYEHGLDRLPASLKAWALRHLRAKLTGPTGAIPDRAERYTSPDGAWMALAQPTPNKIGIPDIDAALARWRVDALIIA